MWYSMSPLALTVVWPSSSRTTATASLGGSGYFSQAAARIQSGALSPARAGGAHTRTNAPSKVSAESARLVLRRFGSLQKELSFVICFHRVEEGLERPVHVLGKLEPANLEAALDHENVASLRGRELVGDDTGLVLLGCRDRLDAITRGSVDPDFVGFLVWEMKVNRVDATSRLK